MGLKIVPEFSSSEFRNMETILRLHTDMLTPVRSEQKILTYIASRTLRFKKFEEHIRAGEFVCGSKHEVHCLPWGLGLHRTTAYRARRGLRRRNLVDIVPTPVVYYRLNLPGILACLVRVAEHLNDTVRANQFRLLQAKAIGLYRVKGWEWKTVVPVEENVGKIEDHVKEGFEKSERSRKKKVKTALKHMKTGWIKPLMTEWAGEFGLEFKDIWTGREAKSAQRFIKYCLEEAIDPRAHLYEVVKHWESIVIRMEALDQPKRRYLSSVVSFSEYFNNRRTIDQILGEIQAEPERAPTEVVTIDEWKRREGLD